MIVFRRVALALFACGLGPSALACGGGGSSSGDDVFSSEGGVTLPANNLVSNPSFEVNLKVGMVGRVAFPESRCPTRRTVTMSRTLRRGAV